MEAEREAFATALEQLAATLRRYPSPKTGISISVVNSGPGSATGMRVSVSGPGATGVRVAVVNDGKPSAADEAVLNEIRDAVIALRSVQAVPRSWIEGVLPRAGKLGNRAIEAAIVAATTATVNYYTRGGG